ncbi:MAG: 2'-5' RNA ligase family protein [Ilumatobacteraceae bacterium]
MGRSALVVLVPAAGEQIERLRLAHDPMAARGVPAHVTVLHPFRATLDDDAHDTIATIAAAVPRWTIRFDTARRFDDRVVYLAPEPPDPFVASTRRLAAAFPDCPPYGGAYAEPTPHLTVGSHLDGEEADRLAAVLDGFAAFTSPADRLTRLVEDDAGMWAIERSWRFGRPRPSDLVAV